MSRSAEFSIPAVTTLPSEDWLRRFAAVFEGRHDIERVFLVSERYPDGSEQTMVHFELVHPPNDDGASMEFSLELARLIPAPGGIVFTDLASIGLTGGMTGRSTGSTVSVPPN